MSKHFTFGLIILIALLIGMVIFYPGGQQDSPDKRNQDQRISVSPNDKENTGIEGTPSPAPSVTPTAQSQPDSSDLETALVDEESGSPLHRIVQPGEIPLPTPTPITLEAGKIVGKVVDENRNPIPSANVHLQSTEGIWIRQIKSDYAGRFVVTDPPPSNVNIRVAMNGYMDNGEGSQVANPSIPEEIVLTLHQQSLAISGKITHRDTKASVSDFSLILTTQDNAVVSQAVSDALGNYSFENVTKGNYTLASGAERNGRLNLDIPPEYNHRKIVIAYQDITDLNFEVVPTLTIKGVVQSMEQIPVAEAEVKSSENSLTGVESDAQGGFEIQAPVGATLLASHELLGLGMSAPITAEQMDSSHPVIIILQSPGSIFGKVSDTNHNPIEQADVALVERRRGITYQTQSNTEGIYSFDDIPLITKGESEEQFTHTIQFSKYGYESKSMDVILYPAEVNTRDVTLQSASSISGQVYDSANNPLPGVYIRASGKMGSRVETVSDEHGVFVLHTNMNETFDIRFEYMSSTHLTAMKLNVPAGTAGLRVILDNQEWVVSGKVSSDTGTYIPQFSIAAIGSSGDAPFQHHQNYMTQDGQYQLVLTQLGQYQIHCLAPGYAPLFKGITIDKSGNPIQNADFVLRQEQSNGSITGTFVPPNGMELAQVDVVGLTSAPTHGNDFFLHKLPEGWYSLLFYVQNNQTRFPIPLGVSQPIQVLRNQETNMGMVSHSDLMVVF